MTHKTNKAIKQSLNFKSGKKLGKIKIGDSHHRITKSFRKGTHHKGRIAKLLK